MLRTTGRPRGPPFHDQLLHATCSPEVSTIFHTVNISSGKADGQRKNTHYNNNSNKRIIVLIGKKHFRLLKGIFFKYIHMKVDNNNNRRVTN